MNLVVFNLLLVSTLLFLSLLSFCLAQSTASTLVTIPTNTFGENFVFNEQTHLSSVSSTSNNIEAIVENCRLASFDLGENYVSSGKSISLKIRNCYIGIFIIRGREIPQQQQQHRFSLSVENSSLSLLYFANGSSFTNANVSIKHCHFSSDFPLTSMFDTTLLKASNFSSEILPKSLSAIISTEKVDSWKKPSPPSFHSNSHLMIENNVFNVSVSQNFCVFYLEEFSVRYSSSITFSNNQIDTTKIHVMTNIFYLRLITLSDYSVVKIHNNNFQHNSVFFKVIALVVEPNVEFSSSEKKSVGFKEFSDIFISYNKISLKDGFSLDPVVPQEKPTSLESNKASPIAVKVMSNSDVFSSDSNNNNDNNMGNIFIQHNDCKECFRAIIYHPGTSERRGLTSLKIFIRKVAPPSLSGTSSTNMLHLRKMKVFITDNYFNHSLIIQNRTQQETLKIFNRSNGAYDEGIDFTPADQTVIRNIDVYNISGNTIWFDVCGRANHIQAYCTSHSGQESTMQGFNSINKLLINNNSLNVGLSDETESIALRQSQNGAASFQNIQLLSIENNFISGYLPAEMENWREKLVKYDNYVFNIDVSSNEGTHPGYAPFMKNVDLISISWNTVHTAGSVYSTSIDVVLTESVNVKKLLLEGNHLETSGLKLREEELKLACGVRVCADLHDGGEMEISNNNISTYSNVPAGFLTGSICMWSTRAVKKMKKILVTKNHLRHFANPAGGVTTLAAIQMVSSDAAWYDFGILEISKNYIYSNVDRAYYNAACGITIMMSTWFRTESFRIFDNVMDLHHPKVAQGIMISMFGEDMQQKMHDLSSEIEGMNFAQLALNPKFPPMIAFRPSSLEIKSLIVKNNSVTLTVKLTVKYPSFVGRFLAVAGGGLVGKEGNSSFVENMELSLNKFQVKCNYSALVQGSSVYADFVTNKLGLPLHPSSSENLCHPLLLTNPKTDIAFLAIERYDTENTDPIDVSAYTSFIKELTIPVIMFALNAHQQISVLNISSNSIDFQNVPTFYEPPSNPSSSPTSTTNSKKIIGSIIKGGGNYSIIKTFIFEKNSLRTFETNANCSVWNFGAVPNVTVDDVYFGKVTNLDHHVPFGVYDKCKKNISSVSLFSSSSSSSSSGNNNRRMNYWTDLSFEMQRKTVGVLYCRNPPRTVTQSALTSSQTFSLPSPSQTFSNIPTKTETETILPIKETVEPGLSEAAVQTLKSTTEAVSGIASLSAMAPMSVATASRGMSALTLLQCVLTPLRNENETTAYIYQRVAFPISFPRSFFFDIGAGTEVGYYARTAMAGFIVATVLAPLIGYFVGMFFATKFNAAAKNSTDVLVQRIRQNSSDFEHSPIPRVFIMLLAFAATGWMNTAVVLTYSGDVAFAVIPTVIILIIVFGWCPYILYQRLFNSSASQRLYLFPSTLYYLAHRNEHQRTVRKFLSSDLARWLFYGEQCYDSRVGLMSFTDTHTKDWVQPPGIPRLLGGIVLWHEYIEWESSSQNNSKKSRKIGSFFGNDDDDSDVGNDSFSIEMTSSKKKKDSLQNLLGGSGFDEFAASSGKQQQQHNASSNNSSPLSSPLLLSPRGEARSNSKSPTTTTPRNSSSSFSRSQNTNSNNNKSPRSSPKLTSSSPTTGNISNNNNKNNNKNNSNSDSKTSKKKEQKQNEQNSSSSNSSNSSSKFDYYRRRIAPFSDFIDVGLTVLTAICEGIGEVNPSSCHTLLALVLTLNMLCMLTAFILRAERVPRKMASVVIAHTILFVQLVCTCYVLGEVARVPVTSKDYDGFNVNNAVKVSQVVVTIGLTVLSLVTFFLAGAYKLLMMFAEARIVSTKALRSVLMQEVEVLKDTLFDRDAETGKIKLSSPASIEEKGGLPSQKKSMRGQAQADWSFM